MGIAADSRQVNPGWVFVAVRGVGADGHSFIASAEAAGACAVVCEALPQHTKAGVSYWVTPNAAEVLGHLAACWHGNPSAALQVVGVTGTNGKTTTTTLLHDLFTALGHTCGLVGTVEVRVGAQVLPATHTTPDPLSLQHLLAQMRQAGCRYVFMEVSSHAIHQRRIAGVQFAGGVFTNITHDHLDYHGTFANYIRAKQMFFDDLPTAAFALSNADDKNGDIMLQNSRARRKFYALRNVADYNARLLEKSLEGLLLSLEGHEVYCRLTGTFNAYNLLAVYAVARELGLAPDDFLPALSNLGPVRGRFQTQQFHPGVTAIVDYAHTPDALLNVLRTLQDVHQGKGRIITLVGCGGNRDAAKRPEMARIAAEYSQQVILTSDNPRYEDPDAILDQMEAGLTPDSRRRSLRVTNRREAIRTAARLAQPGDVLLVAGKGHETYQEVQGTRHPFDDAHELRAAFATLYPENAR
jgi:UDP-N-acetylmuramoyl-L-alanyl-D-glutamate--2,6-diaminopimelate ligase